MAGITTFGFEGQIPYILFDGQTVYIPPDTSVGVITGNWAATEEMGITVGCWMKPDFLPTQTPENGTLIGKISTPATSAAGQYAYVLDLFSPGNIRFWLSSTGGYNSIYVDTVQSSGGVSIDEWNFVVGSWNQDYIRVVVNELTYSMQSTQTEIVNSRAPLTFGGWANGDYKYQGKIAYPFLCFGCLTPERIQDLYIRTKSIFGK